MDKIKVKVFRYDPSEDFKPKYVEYLIPFQENMSILQVLRYIHENIDPTLSFRDTFCKTNQCGLCAMMINGKPAFACHTKLNKEDITVEPLYKYPVIKDLVVDFGCHFNTEGHNFKIGKGDMIWFN